MSARPRSPTTGPPPGSSPGSRTWCCSRRPTRSSGATSRTSTPPWRRPTTGSWRPRCSRSGTTPARRSTGASPTMVSWSPLQDTFAGHHSLALQHTLYEMGSAALAGQPEIAEVRFSAPEQAPLRLRPGPLRPGQRQRGVPRRRPALRPDRGHRPPRRRPRPAARPSTPARAGSTVPERPYELISTPDGLTARIRVRGNDVLRIPMLNRGTAFTQQERARARPGRAAARGGVHDGGAGPRAPTRSTAPARRPGQEPVPDGPARPQRGPVLPAAGRPPPGDAADRLHADHRRGDRALQPRVPAAARGLPVHRPPRGHRGLAGRTTAARRRRLRPHRRHRLRGHPRHRRPGRRRDRDLHRQAHRLHRRRRHPPAPGHPGRARCRHRQPAAAQRPALPGRAARPRPRRALRRLHRRLRHHARPAVPERAAALGGLRGRQRPPHPRPLRRAAAAPSTTTCRAPPRSPSRPSVAAVRVRRLAHARPAGGHPRRRHRRRGHRRLPARRHGAGGAVRGGGDAAVLAPGRRGPAHRPHGGAARLPGAVRPARRRATAAAGASRRSRSGPATAGRPAHRHVDPAGSLLRADRPRAGRARRAADHLPLSNPTSRSRRCRRTCSAGPTAAPWWPPAARSRRSTTTAGGTSSPRPTTRWSSPAWGWASPCPGPGASATA